MPDGRDLSRESARYLRTVYLPRLRRALETLPAGDLWWRPHAGSIAVGNILMHLEGNVRQWILSGLGGAPDSRRRDLEFSTRDGPALAPLLDRLQACVEEAAELVASLPEEALGRLYTIQGTEVSGLSAVLHVVEHFSWHTGQAVWIAKARAGRDHHLHFYDDALLNAAHNAPGPGAATS